MNMSMHYMNGEGFWIPSGQGKVLGRWLISFLQSYAMAAAVALEERSPRWSILPKHHCLHHCALDLYYGGDKGASWLINPVAMSNQMQEDYVGKPSRLSRRVHVQRIHERVMQRALISAHLSIKSSDEDDRGLM